MGEPTHTDTSDTGGWRYLGSALSPQKGIASFNQEDFSITAWLDPQQGGHVSIAERGVENSQLQSLGHLMFGDSQTTQTLELDLSLIHI